MYLAISLLTLVLISSSSTALAQSVHLGRGFGPSGVVKLQSTKTHVGTMAHTFSFLSHRTSGNVQMFAECQGNGPRGKLCPVTSCSLSFDNSLKPLWASFIIFCAPIMCQHRLNHEDNVHQGERQTKPTGSTITGEGAEYNLFFYGLNEQLFFFQDFKRFQICLVLSKVTNTLKCTE